MARASDFSWVWGWLPLDDKYEWDSIFTIDEAFDNKYYNITFAAISVLYKILKAINIILLPIAILLGHWLASLAVLILSVVRLSILVLILKVFGDGFEIHQEVVRPFFSTMWNTGECLSMSSLLTYFPMIRFRVCQAIEIVREHLVSIRDELYEITGIDFHYPDLPDGDITHIQTSDTRAERWMRQLVQEDRIRRQARQDEQDRIAEAENRRRGIENERIGLVWMGLQSRGPPDHQRLRERSGLSLVAALRPREVTLAGSFRASDPVSPPPAREPAPVPSPAPAPADARPIPSGREIKRAWEEGRYISLGPRRTVVKDSSTQTEPTDLASHGTMTEPIELPLQPHVSRGVQTDLVEPPAQEEPEAPVVVPELPVSEPNPDPASPEDTQRSLDRGKALNGPEPTINTNLVIIHEDKAEDEVKEPEYSAVSSRLPASIALPDSPKPTTDAESELVQTHATVLDHPYAIESLPHTPAPAILKPTRQPPVHSTTSAPETSRRIGRGPKSSIRGLKSKEPKGIKTEEKMYEISMRLLEEQPPSSLKSVETQQVIDTTTTSANVSTYYTPISHHDSKHDIQRSPVVRYPLTLELPWPETTEPHATPESTSVSDALTSDPIGIASGAQDDQSEASLQTFAELFSSVVSAENESFTGCQSATVFPNTERNQQAMTEAYENVSKETSLLKVNDGGAALPSASTPLVSNTLSQSVSERTSIGQLSSSHGTSSIPLLEEIEDIEISLDQIIATSLLPRYNESEEYIYDDSLDGHDVVGKQQESLDGGPETPAARTNPHDSDEEMGSFEPGAAGDPGVSSKEEQTPPASTIYDAQMADVWRPNEEESKRIGDAAQDLFKDLMDHDDEDSSEDTKPEREPSMSPMREIVTEDQQANLEDTPMQDMQSSAPPAITAGLHLPIQQPEGPRVQAQPFISPESRPVGQGMSPREEAKLADMLVAAFEEHGPDTPTQDAQPPSVRPQPLTSADPLLEAFRARLKAAETEPQPDKYYAQVPKDRDPPDPVKEATADQRANRKIAKPMSRAHKYTPAAQSTLQSVSQGQPHSQSETLRQTPSQVNEDRGVDIAEMDLAARSLLDLAAATGIVVGNDASNQAASPSGKDSSHKDTDAQKTDAHITSSQKTSTHETNMQESSISDPEVERQTAMTLPEEQSGPNSQQPQSASASILSAKSQPSLVQSTPTQTLPAQPSPAAASTAAAQQHTPTTNNSPTAAGPINTQQQPSICPVMHGGLLLPEGNPTLSNPTATATPAPKKSGPDPEKVAEFHRKKQAQLKKQRPKKPVNIFMQTKRPAAVPSTPNTPQKNPNSSTQGRSPSLTAIDEGDKNTKAGLDLLFGVPGSNKKKQGLQIIDINDIPDHQRTRIQKDDAGRKDEEEE
ncbi:hypothetical protein QWA68_009669 [Fusarium oxysporum]|nr:hypothetical protein QWA68_009669 [Fusarium oxysporum]